MRALLAAVVGERNRLRGLLLFYCPMTAPGGREKVDDQDRLRSEIFRSAHEKLQLSALTTESAHRVTRVASLVLLVDIGDQCLRALDLDFEGGDQRIFGVDDDMSRFPLKFKANRKLRLSLLISKGKLIAKGHHLPIIFVIALPEI